MTDEPVVPTSGPQQSQRPPRPGPPPAQANDAKLRVGDTERAQVIDQLSRHCAHGRLTMDELDERMARAWSARTKGELDELLHDLPPLAAAGAGAPSFGAWMRDGWTMLEKAPIRAVAAGAVALLILMTALLMLAGYPGGDHMMMGH